MELIGTIAFLVSFWSNPNEGLFDSIVGLLVCCERRCRCY
jgi:hypothetical protein